MAGTEGGAEGGRKERGQRVAGRWNRGWPEAGETKGGRDRRWDRGWPEQNVGQRVAGTEGRTEGGRDRRWDRGWPKLRRWDRGWPRLEEAGTEGRTEVGRDRSDREWPGQVGQMVAGTGGSRDRRWDRGWPGLEMGQRVAGTCGTEGGRDWRQPGQKVG